MTLEVRDNHRLEIRLSDAKRPVQRAALEVVVAAIAKGVPVKVEAIEGGFAVVVGE